MNEAERVRLAAILSNDAEARALKQNDEQQREARMVQARKTGRREFRTRLFRASSQS
jgi:folate-dependent phosphoribosylglycinamide formyltransferase PurN